MDCIEEWYKSTIEIVGSKDELLRFFAEDFTGFDFCELLSELNIFAQKHDFEWHGQKLIVEPFGIVFECFSLSGENTDFLIRRTFHFLKGIKRVSHDTFTIPESKRGNGLSKEVINIFYKQYRNAGVEFIDIEAGKVNGGYTWARYGFFATNREQVYEILKNAEMREIPAEEIEIFKAIVDAHYYQFDNQPFPIGAWATLPHGKALLYGNHWSGILDLNNSDQVDIFELYLKS